MTGPTTRPIGYGDGHGSGDGYGYGDCYGYGDGDATPTTLGLTGINKRN